VDYGDGSGVQPLALTGATFQLSHTYADDGLYTVTVAVTDSEGGVGSDTLAVTVVNVAPSVDAGPDQSVAEGQLVSLAPATFADPGTLDTHAATIDWGDGRPVESATVTETPFGPPGSTGGLSGAISASHAYADDGSYTVTLTVIDDDGGTASDSVIVTVANLAPVLAPFPALAADEGSLLSVQAIATDVAADPLTFSLGDGAPAGLTLNSSSGLLTWTPDEAQGPATYTFDVVVTDDEGARAAQPVTIHVAEVNLGPDLAPIAEQAVAEGDTLSFTVTATDPDVPANGLTFSLEPGAPAGATIDPATGLFAWTPADGPGEVTVGIRVTDDGDPALSDVETVEITVGNVAPVLAVTGAAAVEEGAPYLLALGATDPGQDTITQWVITWGDGAVETIADSPSSVTHAYADGPAIYTIAVSATDEDGTYSADPLAVSVSNVAPTVGAGADQAVNEGGSVQVIALFTDPGIADTHSAIIDWGDGIAEAITGTELGTVSGSHIYAEDGGYAVLVTVTDDDGGASSGGLFVTVLNVAPIVEAGADQAVVEGAVVNLASSFSDVGITDTHTATINWGDGSTSDAGTVSEASGAGTVTGAHVYADDGTYTVNLTVTDDDGAATSDTLTIVVGNAVPVVAAGGDLTVGEGELVSLLSPVFTDPGTADTHTATIDWGDGTVEAGLVNAAAGTVSGTHTYGDNGAYVVLVRVRDDDGGEATDSLAVTVANGAPVVDAGGDLTATAASPVTLSASFTDPGSADTHTATINWGDGMAEAGAVDPLAWTVTGTHTYADSGAYAVLVTVVDDDGGAGSDGLTVTVANAAPTITSLAATPEILEGGTVTLTGVFEDGGLTGTYVLIVDWGEGPAETVALAAGARDFTLTHRYLDDDPTGTPADAYRIRARVQDDEGREAAGEVTTLVSNAAPEVTLTAPAIGVRGLAVAFAGRFTDPGILDTHEVAWNFGDGTAIGFHAATDAGALAPSHAFGAAGTYTVTLTVRDDDGGVGQAQATVVIEAVALLPDPCDPEAQALFVGGTSGDDRIRIVPAEVSGSEKPGCGDNGRGRKGDDRDDDHYRDHGRGRPQGVEVWINGVSDGVFAHPGRIIVDGLAGDDDIAIAGSLKNAVELHGGAGADRLEAGAGSALLLGGGGDDRVIGGKGRDLLIGGAGADRLVGGSGDDILIGGTTSYDASHEAFCALLAEWTRRDLRYAERVDHLRNGGGRNGDYRLNEQTVFGDYDEDTLTGGEGQDWFVFDGSKPRNDRVTDRHRSEIATHPDVRLGEPPPEPDGNPDCKPRIEWSEHFAKSDHRDNRDSHTGPAKPEPSWLRRFLLDLAEDRDPNRDIQIVIPVEADSQLSGKHGKVAVM
jgi:PKD repeat protein